MDHKHLSITEISQAKLNQLTSKKKDLEAKLRELEIAAENKAKENKKMLKASQEKIAAVESLIDGSRKEGLEPSQQQVDALASRKNEHAVLEERLAADASAKVPESLRGEIEAQIKALEVAEAGAAPNLELANKLKSEWYGDTFSTLYKGDDSFYSEVSGVPDLLVLPSLEDALKAYFDEMPIKVQADNNNIVTGIVLKPYPGKCKQQIVTVLGNRKYRILRSHLESEWIEQAGALSRNDRRVLEEHGKAPYLCSLPNTYSDRNEPFEAYANKTERVSLLFKERSLSHSRTDYASHPNRACFFYAEDTATPYALKPGSIDRCKLIRREVRSASWYPGESHFVDTIYVDRTPSDCTSIFGDFKEAVDEVIATVSKGIDPENLPKNALADAIAALIQNTTEPRAKLTSTDARPTSEEAFKLIATYWDALVHAPWGPEIIGTYADIKDLCLSGAKPHAWLDNSLECVGLRFKSKTESWLVAHIYCPSEHQGKSASGKIEVRSLQQGSNYKAKGTPGLAPHMIQSGPSFIRILSHPDR